MSVRRRSFRKGWLIVLAVFVGVGLFTFLNRNYGNVEEEAEAASLANFDPGYIISDYQMGNYNAMSVNEIAAFLKAKGNCNYTNLNHGVSRGYENYTDASGVSYNYRVTFSGGAVRYYHVENGHFVCLADEKFNGKSAAEIIYEAAQDYKINPQVLIVLLQKEQSLITDNFPNNVQYRSATGYGCPDTAACNSEYYGFRNQVRKAAALFRTVLDGGWTNYPLGNNYVQYNPSAACGGSVVNIRSLATSALYRYTPYQPNASALAAGYGTGDSCGAYGNRNFYLYFVDWFSDPTIVSTYQKLDTPRYMILEAKTERVNPYTDKVVDALPAGTLRKYVTKIRLASGDWCLRTEYGTEHKEDVCVKLSDLSEVKLNLTIIPEEEREKVVKAGAVKMYVRGETEVAKFDEQMTRKMVAKVEFNGKTYYVTEYDYKNSRSEYGFLTEYVEDVEKEPEYYELDAPKTMGVVGEAKRVSPTTGKYYDTLEKNKIYKFTSVMVVDGVRYYRTEYNTRNGIDAATSEKALAEVEFVNFENPRYLEVVKDVERANPMNGEVFDKLAAGMKIKFTTKILVDGEWYYRTEHNSLNGLCLAVPSGALKEV